MKQCPVCMTTYTDQTLRYCLADGNTLNDLAGELPTVVRQGGALSTDETIAAGRGGHLRVDIPQDTPRTQPQETYQPAPAGAGSSASGGLMKVVLVVLGLGFFAVL